jgi:hypothetical protein
MLRRRVDCQGGSLHNARTLEGSFSKSTAEHLDSVYELAGNEVVQQPRVEAVFDQQWID